MLESGERKKHMRRCHRHERKRRRLFKRKVLRNRQHIAERHFQILRIAAVCLGADESIRATQIVTPRQTLITFPATEPRRHEYSLPHGDAINMRADLLHDPGRIRPRHMRKRHGIGRIALSYPNVEVIQRTGLDANPYILRTDHRLWQIFIGKFVRSPMLTEEYSLHRISFLHSVWLIIFSDVISFLRAGCSKSLLSKAAGESKPEAYPQGYVEDFDEPRTPLAGFFSILLKGQRSFEHHDTLPSHLDRLDDIVIRLDPHKYLRRTLNLIALLNDDVCRRGHVHHAILHQVGSQGATRAAGRRIFKNPNCWSEHTRMNRRRRFHGHCR